MEAIEHMEEIVMSGSVERVEAMEDGSGYDGRKERIALIVGGSGTAGIATMTYERGDVLIVDECHYATKLVGVGIDVVALEQACNAGRLSADELQSCKGKAVDARRRKAWQTCHGPARRWRRK